MRARRSSTSARSAGISSRRTTSRGVAARFANYRIHRAQIAAR
jgi:hypothetical protein